MRTSALPRRILGALAVAVLAATALAAAPAPAGAKAKPAYPVVVEHEFGTTEVPRRPARVVALGWGDAEAALALGVQPIGAVDWLQTGSRFGVGKWAEDRYDKAPTLLASQFDFEAIAALRPDLILNTASDADPATHATLSRLAPTIALPAGTPAWGTSWDDQLTQVGAALGRSKQAKRLVKATNAAFADAAADHPELAGKTVVVAASRGGMYGAYLEQDIRTGFMTRLGMTSKPELEALGNGTAFFVPISAERADMLDADLVVMLPLFDTADMLANDQVLTSTASAKAGNLVIVDDLTLAAALSSGSVLASRYALEHGVPLFARAVA